MRNFVILVLIIIAMAMLRRLLVDVVGAVKNALGSPGSGSGPTPKGERAQSGSEPHTGHMVRDPISGTYIDEQLAIKETVNGKTFFFESKENRDAYLRQARSG